MIPSAVRPTLITYLPPLIAHLGCDVVLNVPVKVFLGLVVVPIVAVAARMMPILCLRVVEAELHAVSLASCRELAHRIALERRGRDDAVVAHFGFEHREAV